MYRDIRRHCNRSLEGSKVDHDEGILDNDDASVDAFDLLFGPLALPLPASLPPLEVAAQAPPVTMTLPGTARGFEGHPGPRNAPILAPGLAHLFVDGPGPINTTVTSGPGPDAERRGRSTDERPLGEVVASDQVRGERHISNRDAQRSREEISPAHNRSRVGHHGGSKPSNAMRTQDRGRTQDRRLDLPTRIAQSSVPTTAEYPKLDGQCDHGSALSGGGSMVNNQGKPSDASALRSVEAPESSVDGTDSGSTSGSECRTESTEAERHDNPVLGDVTNHVARWTTVGDDVTMRDTSNALKTVQLEQ
ncbi:hypothetical protein RSAG8_11074, partial [Rhizoctonia solani AG-8 WAC10335]